MGWGGKAALLAFAFFGLGTMVYILYRKRERDENRDDCLSVTTTKGLKVPKEAIGLIIGRGGSRLKELEELTETRIHFRDLPGSNSHKLCLVQGAYEGIEMAEQLIHETIVNQPLIETHVMFVSLEAYGRLIGKNGNSIRSISRTSNAKIIFHDINMCREKLECQIRIKGTMEQIEYAKFLIEQKLEEDKALRSAIQSSLTSRSPRHRAKYLLPGPEEPETMGTSTHKEALTATGSDGLLEVYVSAIHDPEKFWVQMMGPSTVALDRLNEQMTDYYSKEENRQLHILKEVVVDQIVAAPFFNDNKWYRAEVSDIKVDEYDEGEFQLSLYYVDYGDSAVCKKKDVYELRTDFLRLRFQAIECILAKVKPRGTWSEAAIELFETLTYTGLWKSLTAKVDGYRERPTRAKREGSPVPCVELYDSQAATTINVGKELVKNGFAVWEEEESSSPGNSSETK